MALARGCNGGGKAEQDAERVVLLNEGQKVCGYSNSDKIVLVNASMK